MMQKVKQQEVEGQCESGPPPPDSLGPGGAQATEKSSVSQWPWPGY